jgi:hypothetical protein
MDKNTKDMLDALDFIKQHMATKDEIADLKATMATKDDINSISNELTSIRRDLGALTDKVDNIVYACRCQQQPIFGRTSSITSWRRCPIRRRILADADSGGRASVIRVRPSWTEL